MARGGPIISNWHCLVDGFNTSSLDFYKAVEDAVRTREVPDATFSRVAFKEGGFASAKREYLRVERGSVAFDIGAAPYGKSFFFSWWLSRLGPAHPWLWLLGLLLVLALWFIAIASILAEVMTGSTAGGGFALIASVFLVFAGFPGIVFLAGWATHKGHIPVDEEKLLFVPVLGWLYDKVFSPITYHSLDTALMFQESVRRAVNEVIEGLMSGQGLKALTDDQKKPSIRDLSL